MYEHYERFYSEFFNRKHDDAAQDTFFMFGWLLYIVVSNQYASWLSDFETSYHLFASSMLFFWKNANIEDIKIKNVPKEDLFKFLFIREDSIHKSILDIPQTIISNVRAFVC